MALSIIEWMALLIVVLAAVKIAILLIKPKKWASVIDIAYSNTALTTVIYFILALIVLNYLLAELTIVQIFASMLFLAFLLAIGITAYGKEIVPVAKKLLNDRKIIKKGWFAIVIWILLIIWVLYEIFV